VAAATLGGCAGNVAAPVLLTLPDLTEAAAAPDAAAAPSGAASGAPAARVHARLTLPEYLVVRRVRYRADPATLAEWPNTFWGERVEIGAARSLGTALRQQLPGWVLCDASCEDSSAVWGLRVDFEVLDYLRGAQQLQARVRLSLSRSGASTGAAAVQQRSYVLASGGDTAQAQARVTAQMMQRVAVDAAAMLRAAAR
jgi:uncharacterized lipoprotein YmbA